MDKESTIIGLGLVILTALPFIIYNLLKKIKKKKFLKEFIDMSVKAKLTLSHKELWNKSYAIGIDANTKKLLYLNKQDAGEGGTLIDLSEIEQCRMVTTDRYLKSQDTNNNQTNRIDLVLTHINSNKVEKILEFYKNAEFLPTADDFAQVDYWLNMINSNLKNS